MSNFEIATLDLREKADIRPLFPGANFKITNFEISSIDLIYSYVCFYENCINPFESKRLSISDFSKHAKYSVRESHDVLIKANEIIQKKIKPLDALHLSCAINAKADYFITVDDGILSYNTNEINIFDPILFIKHWEIEERKND
jgi:predicted nucleic acid-binding protein